MSDVEERETILWAEDSLHLWNTRRPGFSIFGSYEGRALLTSRRFLFLSTGGSGVARRLAVGAALGPIGSMIWGKTPTGELDLSALEAEGSIEIPLASINDHAAHKRCDCAMYVGIQYRKPDDSVDEVSFMPKDSLGWSAATQWAEELTTARSAFTAAPYR